MELCALPVRHVTQDDLQGFASFIKNEIAQIKCGVNLKKCYVCVDRLLYTSWLSCGPSKLSYVWWKETNAVPCCLISVSIPCCSHNQSVQYTGYWNVSLAKNITNCCSFCQNWEVEVLVVFSSSWIGFGLRILLLERALNTHRWVKWEEGDDKRVEYDQYFT